MSSTATFSIATSSSSVNVTLTWNALSSNTWRVGSGDATLLSTSSGTWWFTAQNQDGVINMAASSNVVVCSFTRISMTNDLSDPFRNVASGATNPALITGLDDLNTSWTRTGGANASSDSTVSGVDDSMYAGADDSASTTSDDGSGGGDDDSTADA